MRVKIRNSIRIKLTLLLLGLTAGSFFVYLLVNQFFLEDYYIYSKENKLIDSYENIDKIIGNNKYYDSETSNAIANVCETSGITIIIVNPADEIEFQYGNGTVLKSRLQQINFGINPLDCKTIKKTDNYILQSYSGNADSYGYMELCGIFDNNRLFLMRMAVESINESVSISRTFFIYVGIVVCIMSMIIAFLVSGKFAKPILNLAQLSEKMSNLDFGAKYVSKSNDEIGVLGNSMNKLSDKLEQTILELKSANNELKKDIEKKNEIDEMRKDFISNVSHELKTPIALIQGYAEGLSECVNDDPESREFYCEVIADESDKMNKMVKGLLSLTRLEFGNGDISFERFDIVMVVKGVLNSLNYMIEQSDIKVDFDDSVEFPVCADEFQIEEVITNYLTNAIHYAMEPKQIIINIKEQNSKIRVSVYNTGNNISEDDLENIWIKFYKVDKARTREYGGSGIGLSIVKAIMNAHSNMCGVENKEGGVEFWFEVDKDISK